jgi:Domain of unknown function (DUF3418)
MSAGDETEELGWLVEELRVQTCAPELRVALPISSQRLQDVWKKMSRLNTASTRRPRSDLLREAMPCHSAPVYLVCWA